MAEFELTEDLCRRLEKGEESAIEELFRRYRDDLVAVAGKRMKPRLRRRVDPDDIVQSVFRVFTCDAREGKFGIEHESSLWRLLVRITVNKVVGQAQHHHQQKRSLDCEVYTDTASTRFDLTKNDQTPSAVVALREEVETLMFGMDSRDGDILRLVIEEHPLKEIAEQMGLSLSTVRRVKKAFEERLERRLKYWERSPTDS